MLKKLLTVTVLGLATATPLLAGGCASDNDKGAYGLTGTESQLTADQQRWVNQHSVDQKGHFNPILHQQALNQMRSANPGAQ
jgi:hypothetical protein